MRRCVAHKRWGSYAQGQGPNQVRGQIVPKIVLLINYWSKFDKSSQKDKTLWEGVSHTWFRFLCPRSRSWSGQRSKSCLSNNSKTSEANLTKLHRKIEHYDKVFHAQELGSYAQGQGSLTVFKVTARDQGHYKGPSGAFVTYCNISCFCNVSALYLLL